MNQNRNLFSQAFKILRKLRALAFAYFGVNCAVSIVGIWYPDNLATMILYAPFGAVFSFYFFCQLFGVSKECRSLKLFGSYATRYVLLMFVLGFAGLYFVVENYSPPTAGTSEQALRGLVFLLSVFLVTLLPMYLFGTVLPAQVVGKQKQIWEGVRRSVRQAGYQLPRVLGCFLPFVIFQSVLSGVMPTPVTLTGEINTLGFLLMIVSNILGIIGEAVLWVIFARAYLKDLRERGEIPAVDEEVFA